MGQIEKEINAEYHQFPSDSWVFTVGPGPWSFGGSFGDIHNFKPHTHLLSRLDVKHTFWECVSLEAENLEPCHLLSAGPLKARISIALLLF